MEGGVRCPVCYYPSNCSDTWRKTTKILSQDIRYPGRHLNPESFEYEAAVSASRFLADICLLKGVLS
jgi:hypothetical protein